MLQDPLDSAMLNLDRATRDLIRDTTLAGEGKKVLFGMFWHSAKNDVLREVSPFFLRHIMIIADREADPRQAERSTIHILEKFKKAGLIVWDETQGDLGGPISLTEYGERYVRMENLPPRPLEVFLRDMAKHKIAILATMIGLISGSLAIYEFIRHLLAIS